MKRLAVLAMYSKNGMVYDYIEYLIKELRREVQAFYVVCNSALRIEEQEKVKPYINDIFFRNDEGYDATAFKQTFEEYLGWEKIYKFDELVLLNDSFFGPFIPFADIFNKMSKRECDFWTFTSNQDSNTSMGEVSFHFQPYFWVIREHMLKHESFRKFWETLPKLETYKQAVLNYELRMTEYFNHEGFEGSAYVDGKGFISEELSERYLYTMFDPYALVAHKGCPVVKKKCFLLDRKQIYSMSEYEDIVLLMKYLRQNSNYDTDMIWQVLLDQNRFSTIDNHLCMEYIAQEKTELDDYDKGNIAKSLIIIYIDSEIYIDDVFAYVKNIDRYIDVKIIYNQTMEKKLECRELLSKKVQLIEYNKKFTEYVNYCRPKYEYLCVINLQNIYETGKPLKTGRSRLHLLLENSIGSIGLIADILQHLSEEKLLSGMVVEDHMWSMDFLNTEAAKIGVVWMKNRCEDIETLTGVQGLCDMILAGDRYEGVLSAEYARIRLNFFRRMVLDFSELIQINNEKALHDACRIERIVTFCKNKKEIYIFGNGIYGKECYQILSSRDICVSGFLVTKLNEMCSNYLNVPVYGLDDMMEADQDWSQAGVIVCVTQSDANSVKEQLNSFGCDNVLVYE